jgi:hypothetical protein
MMSAALEFHALFWRLSSSHDNLNYSTATTVSCYALYANKYSVQCRVASRSANRRLEKKTVSIEYFFLFRFAPNILDLVKITFSCHRKRDFYAEKSLVKVEKPVQKFFFDIFIRKKSPSHRRETSNYDTSANVRKFVGAKRKKWHSTADGAQLVCAERN